MAIANRTQQANAEPPTADIIAAFRGSTLAPADTVEQNNAPIEHNPTEPIPTYAGPDLRELTAQLLRDAAIMKRARFNAAQRLRKKHDAGQFTFAISGVYGFLVPLFTLQFGTFLSPLATNLITFAAASAGAISFVVAMLYQQQAFQQRSDQLHTCGRKLNNLRRTLKATRISDDQQLRTVYHHYDVILGECENHDDIDYRMATQSPQTMRLRMRLFIETYAVCVFVWLAPPLIAIATWTALSP